MEEKHYSKLFVSLAISFVVMYSVMFLNVDELNHIYLSQTRLYMSLLMVTPMAIIMIMTMAHMYQDKKKNLYIMIGSVAAFAIALFLLRSQALVGDVQFMKAMIPHHSSAILTSQHANIDDPEVRELAEQIIKSQKREIDQMKNIIERLSNE